MSISLVMAVYNKLDLTKKCYERVHIRAREGEEVIPLAYLEDCHKYHEEFLEKAIPFLTK